MNITKHHYATAILSILFWLCCNEGTLMASSLIELQSSLFSLSQTLSHSCFVSPTKNIQRFIISNNVDLIVEQGDIVTCHVDAIVNAANEQLESGGGVCGSIFGAAGKEKLQQACYKIHPITTGSTVRCTTGSACITESFALRDQGISYVIHAVGPDCKVILDYAEQDRLLLQTYTSALKIAHDNNIQSIAFPLISSAIYGCSQAQSAQAAIKAIRNYATSHADDAVVKKIHFILFDQTAYDNFIKNIQPFNLTRAS